MPLKTVVYHQGPDAELENTIMVGGGCWFYYQHKLVYGVVSFEIPAAHYIYSSNDMM